MSLHTRLFRAAQRVERRVFLKALGLGLSMPIAAKLGQLALAQASGPLKRMLVLTMPHGMAPEHYNPRVNADNPTDFALDKTNESTLGPLEAYKKYVNVYQGFQYPGTAAAHDGVVNYLSGYQGSDDTTARTSFEHVIGKSLGIKPLILGAVARPPFGLDRNSKTFWNGTPVDPEKDPAAVADRLFTGGTSVPTTSAQPAADPALELRAQLLGLTRSELTELKGTVSGLTKEQSKLQTHLDSLQALQVSTGGGGGGAQTLSCSTKPNLPLVEEVRSAMKPVVDSSGGNDYFYQFANFPLLFKAQLQLAAAALTCGAAPIIGVQPLFTTCDIDWSFAGTPGSHHNTLSHKGPEQSTGYMWDSPVGIQNMSPTARASFGIAQRWFTDQLVEYIVKVLASTDDPTAPGTSVLDNTLIYWTSEIADGANHLRSSGIELLNTPQHLPLVTIGGAGGALKTGQVYAAPFSDLTKQGDNVARPATDLYLTLAKAMGASSATFPDTTGVVSEVLT